MPRDKHPFHGMRYWPQSTFYGMYPWANRPSTENELTRQKYIPQNESVGQ